MRQLCRFCILFFLRLGRCRNSFENLLRSTLPAHIAHMPPKKRQLTMEIRMSQRECTATAGSVVSAVVESVFVILNQEIACFLSAKEFVNFYITLRSLQLNISIPESLFCHFIDKLAKNRRIKLSISGIKTSISLSFMNRCLLAIRYMYNCEECNSAGCDSNVVHCSPIQSSDLSHGVNSRPPIPLDNLPILYVHASLNPKINATLSYKTEVDTDLNYIEAVGTVCRCADSECGRTYCVSCEKNYDFMTCDQCLLTICSECNYNQELNIDDCERCGSTFCSACSDSCFCERCDFNYCVKCTEIVMRHCSICQAFTCLDNKCADFITTCEGGCSRSICDFCMDNFAGDIYIGFCSKCTLPKCSDCGIHYCNCCDLSLCSDCGIHYCNCCDYFICSDCGTYCGHCDDFVCSDCGTYCDHCDDSVCDDCGIYCCGVCYKASCSRCFQDSSNPFYYFSCLTCRDLMCELCSQSHFIPNGCCVK